MPACAPSSLIQAEALSRFFVATYKPDLTYEDDVCVIARENLTSLSGFWSDGAAVGRIAQRGIHLCLAIRFAGQCAHPPSFRLS